MPSNARGKRTGLCIVGRANLDAELGQLPGPFASSIADTGDHLCGGHGPEQVLNDEAPKLAGSPSHEQTCV